MKRIITLSTLVLCAILLNLDIKSQGLEGIIVERYYVDAPNATDTTYRVFVDMAPGYKLLAVYGFDNADPDVGNSLAFTTTTGFYNDLFGATFGNTLNSLLFNAFPNSAIDTYLSFGAAATNQFGIPKADDTDGSTLVSSLTNVPPDGISPSTVDGFLAGSTTGASTLALTDDGASNNGDNFIGSSDGSYFVLGGVSGSGPNNTLLIGQFTTDGDFEFEINIQIQSADGVNELYVHTNAEQPDGSFGTVSPFLKFPITGVIGCTDSEACNYNADATLDDGSCIVPVPDCTECNDDNTGLDLIDDDGDGICNADEVPGCTNPNACNFNNQATDDDGSCTEEPVENCSFCVGSELVLIDDDNDGICNAEEVPGCTNPNACNYNDLATDDDGSCTDEPIENCTECQGDDLVLIDDDNDGICNAEEIPGCTNQLACNYDPGATDDDGSCTDEPVENCTECQGENLVIIDSDGDGVCDADEVAGCTNALSCNFNPDATDDDGSCTDEPIPNCTECQGQDLVLIDDDGDGICNADEVPGCTSSTACNFDANATDDDGTCIEPVENCTVCNDSNDGLDLIDTDNDGVCDADDECPELPDLVNGDPCVTEGGFDGTIAGCECVTDVVLGCISPTACNFDPGANLDDGSCIEPIENCLVCNDNNDGLDIVDSDGDGVCDADEIPGCTNTLSCNFNPSATDDDGSCTDVPVENCTECQGDELVLIDTDGDGICDADEIPGCTNQLACNYNPAATDDDGTCTDIPVENCTECQGENLVIIDSDGDGICDADEVPGCTNALSCNFNPAATDDDGSCTDIPVENCTECQGDDLVLIDTDGDGICDADEVPGCTNPNACNFNDLATDDDGSCTEEPVPNCTECQGEELVLIDTDGDGVCDADEVPGCTNELSCNYNPEATDDDGSCTDEPVENCSECQGEELVLIDSDGDGICDADEIPGCTDPEAENYNPEATDEDGSCLFIASLTLLELECGEKVIQITNAQATTTDGGEAIADRRTVYAFGPDGQDGNPTFSGDTWPFVIAPVGFSVDDADINADVSVNDDNVVLIDGRPVYQYTGDTDENSTEGTFGPWSYFLPNGWINQDACGTVGLTEYEEGEIQLNLFPNPAYKEVNIDFSNIKAKPDQLEVSIYNAIGELIIRKESYSLDNENLLTIDTQMLSQGVYLINIQFGNKEKSLRFFKR